LINSAIWTFFKFNQQNYKYIFDKADINHITRLYKKYSIEPETLEIVRIDFILQTEKLARYIIKEFDILLKKDGIFELLLFNDRSHGLYYRSKDQVKYEFSISTNGRYKLIDEQVFDKTVKLVYKKTTQTNDHDDNIGKWTFGTITNGKNIDKVDDLLESIIKQNIPYCEILVCGPYPITGKYYNNKFVKILPDVLLENDCRFPISRKKNSIILEAKYQNIFILHDRFILPDNWFIKMNDYGNYFDYINIPTIDYKGNRFMVDWMIFSYPITRRNFYNRPLNYNNWSPQIIVQGGAILVKKYLLINNLIDQRLHWGELEDIHHSKIAFLNGAFFYLDPNNKIISLPVNHISRKVSNVLHKKLRILFLLNVIKSYFKFRTYIIKYYKNSNASK